MANNADEAPELAALGGSLVVNMGTVTPDGIASYVKAAQAYNACGGPVVFDPVGAGATSLRRRAVTRLMSDCYFEVVKGNENEISVLLGESAAQQRGVDSALSTLSDFEKASIARKLAARERSVVVLTGKTDYISDGSRTYSIRNGSEYLGRITGSGCTLGTTIAACLTAQRNDKLLATLSAMLLFEISSERAAKREEVKGPGTFVPAFVDELYRTSKLAVAHNKSWLASAKVEEMDMTPAKNF
ncbi:MAG: hypothetical protein Q9222_007744 [Ikaeria aurantiellina]